MGCITCHPPSISSIVTYSKTSQHFNSTTAVCHPISSKVTRHLQWQNRVDGSVTVRAAPATLLIAATSPPNSGDLSVLFQTSAVMLFMYWIANFVVPGFVMKDLQGDKANADAKKGNQNLSDNGQGSTPTRTAGSGTKKSGFSSTKQ